MEAKIHEIEYFPTIPSQIFSKYETIQHLTVVSTYQQRHLYDYEDYDSYYDKTFHIELVSSVAIDNRTGHIYIIDVGKGILVFTEYGEYISTIRHLDAPSGILIHKEFLYITDQKLHAIVKFSLHQERILSRAGKYGSGRKELYFPSQLAISPTQCIYVADSHNHRLQILSCDLVF